MHCLDQTDNGSAPAPLVGVTSREGRRRHCAGRALGLGRTTSHALARADTFPVPVLRLGRLYRVPTATVLELLSIRPDDQPQDPRPAA